MPSWLGEGRNRIKASKFWAPLASSPSSRDFSRQDAPPIDCESGCKLWASELGFVALFGLRPHVSVSEISSSHADSLGRAE